MTNAPDMATGPGPSPIRPAPFDDTFAADIHDRLADLRGKCPVTEVSTTNSQSLWLVLDRDDVTACLTDPRLSVQRDEVPSRQPGQRATQLGLMNYEPPDHTRIRRLSNTALTERNLRQYRSAFTAALHRILDDLGQSPDPVDLISTVCKPFTFDVLAIAMNLRPVIRPELAACVNQVFQRRRDRAAATEANLDRIEQLLAAELRDRRDSPGDDVLSRIQQAWQVDGGLDEAELLSLVTMLLLAGFDSTAHMIGICVIALSRFPHLADQLRADPTIAPTVVEELLRWDTSGPFSTPRWARADIRLGGRVIPRGSRVVLSFLAANHDPRHYADPSAIDLERTGPRHLAFGHGPHFCPGSALARLELSVAVTVLAQRFPLLQLAIPIDEVPWGGTYQQRTIGCLPVRLRP